MRAYAWLSDDVEGPETPGVGSASALAGPVRGAKSKAPIGFRHPATELNRTARRDRSRAKAEHGMTVGSRPAKRKTMEKR